MVHMHTTRGVDPSHFYPTGTSAENTGRDYSTITCTPGRDSKTKPGRDCFLLYFITPTATILVRQYMDPDRDYPRSMKLHPTGTILVREYSPDRVSSCASRPHFHLSARGRHPSYHASPTSTLRRLHFATPYLSGTGSFLDLHMHTTSNTGRVLCLTC